MAETVARETQMDAALHALERAYAMGWAKVTVEVTRGGTFRIDAEASSGAKVASPIFTSGRKR